MKNMVSRTRMIKFRTVTSGFHFGIRMYFSMQIHMEFHLNFSQNKIIDIRVF